MDPLSILGDASLVFNILGRNLGLLQSLRNARPTSAIVLSFRTLQASRIEQMQDDLLKLQLQLQHLSLSSTSRSNEGGEVVDELTNLTVQIDNSLHTYATALRDYETFSQESVAELSPIPNIFSLWSDILSGKQTFRHGLRDRKALVEQLRSPEHRYNFRELNREIRLEREKNKAFWERLWMGAFGGLTLIGPMLLMVLHRDQNTSVITASVGTLLFALVLAVSARNLRGMDVLAATAAYAAVLVVFVGTSMAPITQ